MPTKKQIQPDVKPPRKTRRVIDAEAFVKEYKDNGYNATAAVEVLEPTVSSKEVAANKGNRMLQKATVKALLDGTEQRAKRALDDLTAMPEHKDHFNAVKLALAYKYGTPVARTENTNITVTVEDLLRAE